ncbi:uncharacterized protein LOC119995112 isoform X2 [Tripterygium wilfordii]|nr:uncharacterized protein LOC119995112 isoform X2 [Tripterygium wilfordii]
MKANLNDVHQHCSLDVLPILFEEAALPAAEKWPFHNTHGQDVYSISVLSKEGNTSPNCTSHLAFLSFLGVPIPSKNEMCLDIQSNCRDYIDVQIESADAYTRCILDSDIEKEMVKIPKTNNETAQSTKSGALTKVLLRQASLKSGGKLMQPLMTYGSMLLKFLFKDKASIERGLDTPNNRWRRYKRASPFDSRRIVIFFSILSSFGTLVLIYLTLRVREAAADGYVNV